MAEPALAVISNSKALLKDIQAAAQEVEGLKKERKAINQRIQAVREGLEAKGIDKKAFDDVMKYFAANLADRDGYEDSRKMVHEALSEIQEDLFTKKGDEE